MRKQTFALLLALVLLLTGCAQAASYEQITREECDQSHIPGALTIPHTEIAERAEEELPDKDQPILVYCRSEQASEVLAELGYTNVKEFGGIHTLPYEVE